MMAKGGELTVCTMVNDSLDGDDSAMVMVNDH